jgi:hypothetical protein
MLDSDGEKKEITTTAKAQKYEQLMPLLVAMCKEFQEASKKKPEAVLNKRKVQIVNRLLKDVIAILEEEESHAYLDLLDEDDLPQNSDVSLILGQTQAAMGAFHGKYHKWDANQLKHCWTTSD